MAAADDEARSDPTGHRLRTGAAAAGDGPPVGDVDTAVGPERVNIHGIADKVKGLLRPRS